MKRFLLFLSLVFSLFLCVATHEVSASEETWYTIAAEKANNPVLLNDDQYFQGVSINSHVISDLTFLQIPFEKYLNYEEKQMQVIAFSEALYTKNDEDENEVVLYLYSPDKNSFVSYLYTKMSIVSYDILSPEGTMIDVGDRGTYEHKWSAVSYHGSIIKMSFSESTKNKESIKKILLSNYDLSNTMEHTIVSTIFDLEIKKAQFTHPTYSQAFLREVLLKNNKLIHSQQFNFVYEKTVDHPEAVALLSDDVETAKRHNTTSIGYNETTAKVAGAIYRLRYYKGSLAEEDLGKLVTIGIGFKDNEYQYLDVFYYFFNVTDAATGKLWTGKEVITKIQYNFYEYLQEIKLDFHYSVFQGQNGDGELTVAYLSENGKVYATDKTALKNIDYDDDIDYAKLLNDPKYVRYRDSSTLTSIYQTKTVEPGTFSNKFPVKKDSVSIMDYIFGTVNNYYTATMPYLFSTSDTNYVNSVDANIYSDVKLSDFQYGMLVGKEGYAVSRTEKVSNGVWGNFNLSQSCVELVSVDDIWYEFEGEKYHASVTETTVDKSQVNNPIEQGPVDPLFPTVPEPEEPSWWEKLLEWLKENWPVLVFTAALILVIIIIFKVINKIIDYRSKKAIIKMTNEPEPKKKKE